VPRLGHPFFIRHAPASPPTVDITGAPRDIFVEFSDRHYNRCTKCNGYRKSTTLPTMNCAWYIFFAHTPFFTMFIEKKGTNGNRFFDSAR